MVSRQMENVLKLARVHTEQGQQLQPTVLPLVGTFAALQAPTASGRPTLKQANPAAVNQQMEIISRAAWMHNNQVQYRPPTTGRPLTKSVNLQAPKACHKPSLQSGKPAVVDWLNNGMLQAAKIHTNQHQELLPTLPPLLSGYALLHRQECSKSPPCSSRSRSGDFACQHFATGYQSAQENNTAATHHHTDDAGQVHSAQLAAKE